MDNRRKYHIYVLTSFITGLFLLSLTSMQVVLLFRSFESVFPTIFNYASNDLVSRSLPPFLSLPLCRYR